jgi:hypothetical protein
MARAQKWLFICRRHKGVPHLHKPVISVPPNGLCATSQIVLVAGTPHPIYDLSVAEAAFFIKKKSGHALFILSDSSAGGLPTGCQHIN